MNRKYLLIKSVEIYVEQKITDHWYSIRPPRPVEKLCASETVEYAFKKVEQLGCLRAPAFGLEWPRLKFSGP